MIKKFEAKETPKQINKRLDRDAKNAPKPDKKIDKRVER